MKYSNSLQLIIGKLEDLFDKFNKKFFNNELEKPVITVSPDTTRGAYGWCTAWKAWKDGDDSEGYYEINMCAEYLSRPFEETCETLIHEMVHLMNLQNEVQDTSRSGMYHNKKFKQTAEQHGLTVEKDSKYGWCITRLNDEVADYVSSLDEEGFKLYRSKILKIKTSSSSSSRKYICPGCGTIIRATKEVRVICSSCDIEFEEEI
jgi:rubrerythrin